MGPRRPFRGLRAARLRPTSAGMKKLHRYEVQPSVPAPLEPLFDLAYNLWWSWNAPARDLFARVDPELYERVSENPIALLRRAPQERLDALAADEGYLAELAR